MRDAISLLDQLASTGQTITLESAQAVLGTAASQAVLEVVHALVNQQADVGLESIHATLDAGSDPRQFARQICGLPACIFTDPNGEFEPGGRYGRGARADGEPRAEVLDD
jgi:hypothetical protein